MESAPTISSVRAESISALFTQFGGIGNIGLFSGHTKSEVLAMSLTFDPKWRKPLPQAMAPPERYLDRVERYPDRAEKSLDRAEKYSEQMEKYSERVEKRWIQAEQYTDQTLKPFFWWFPAFFR